MNTVERVVLADTGYLRSTHPGISILHMRTTLSAVQTTVQVAGW